jgi:ADP-heptose:LPS heptosyltransferase
MNVCLDLSECNGLGDLICATPTISKLFLAYETPIMVLSKMPELFKFHPCVNKSYKTSSVDHDYIKANYIVHNSFYNVGKKNERGVEFKHNRIDIRQFHAINLGFTLLPEEMECFYNPTEDCIHPIPEEPYVVIHPVRTWDSRTWSVENWEELAKRLIEAGYVVVAIGKDDSETGFFNVKKPVHEIKQDGIVNLMNKTTISDCWHLIRNSRYFVTMDSGLLHLAGTTNAEIIHLGSSIYPFFRAPYRRGSQTHNYHYVAGSCNIFCGSDMKYGVKEWGNIQGVPPLIRCLENKETYECHPSVEQVINIIL